MASSERIFRIAVQTAMGMISISSLANPSKGGDAKLPV
jgi:hypothetical protein